VAEWNCTITSKTGLVLSASTAGITAVTPTFDLRSQQFPLAIQWAITVLDGDIQNGANWLIRSLAYQNAFLTVIDRDSGYLAVEPPRADRSVQTWNVVVATGPGPSYWDWTKYTPVGAVLNKVDPRTYSFEKGGLAFRPAFDFDRNLNILGDGPYASGSRVAAWDGWGGGDANEMWLPVTYDAPLPPIDPPPFGGHPTI
jgi:hypothetical protein